MTGNHSSRDAASAAGAAGAVGAAGESRVRVVKGNLDPTQRTALDRVIDEIAGQVEERRRAKPDTRGRYGMVGDAHRFDTPEHNPVGFRYGKLPRSAPKN